MRVEDWVSENTQYYQSSSPLELDNGGALERWQLAYRTWGELNKARSNAVLVCHALTGSADADDWWGGLFGAGKALDPARDFIVCSNVVGGCYGSTGPQTLGRDALSNVTRPADFPIVTIRDMVRAQERLLQSLEVDKLALILGPSLGGMQVLEWAASFPEKVAAIVPVGVSGRHSAWCIGTSEAQRQAIFKDPAWRGGNYTAESAPNDGFSVARMMAMLSYRSWENFEDRFARETDKSNKYSINSYLNYQGEKITQRFDALSYVRLTQAMDTHDLARGRGEYAEAVGSLTTPALVVAVTSDVLYPPREQEELAKLLPNAELRYLESSAGHDGFLIDTNELSAMILEFRARLESSSQRTATA